MAKKITKWEPDDFELEMTTHWSFPKCVVISSSKSSGSHFVIFFAII